MQSETLVGESGERSLLASGMFSGAYPNNFIFVEPLAPCNNKIKGLLLELASKPLWGTVMLPIHKLLSRIRWDRDFGSGSFVLGYYDRVENRIVRVKFTELIFKPGESMTFQLMDADGIIHSVPLHRVREVYKDGELIWHRKN